MKATILYRIAAVVFVLFAVGHTVGFLSFKAPTPEGRAVRESMDTQRFQVKGASLSYGGFYTGFGLSATANLVFSAFLAWHLGTLAAKNPSAIGLLGWAFCALQIVGVVLSFVYFSTPPAVLSAAVTLCLGWAAWLVTAAS